MRDSEVQRLDPVEIFLVDIMLSAGPVGFRHAAAEEVAQGRDRRLQHVIGRHRQRHAAFQQFLAEVLVDQGEEHQPRLGLDMLERALKLFGAADQRIEMLVHHDAFELRQRRARDGVQGLAGRV